MTPNPDPSLRDRLLGQHAPAPDTLATYRTETLAMLEREERRLRFVRWAAGALWVFLVGLGVALALVAGWSEDKPPKVYFSIGLTMTLCLLGGAVQLVSGFISRARLEVVKDIKGLELRILELESLIRGQAK